MFGVRMIRLAGSVAYMRAVSLLQQQSEVAFTQAQQHPRARTQARRQRDAASSASAASLSAAVSISAVNVSSGRRPSALW